MRSIANRHGKRKRLGEAAGWSAMDFHTQPMDTKVELIRALIPLGLMAVQKMLEVEVCRLAGGRYSRDGDHYRHGTNPGSVKLQGQRHRVRVPRVRDRRAQEVPLESWAALRETREADEVLLRRVLTDCRVATMRRPRRPCLEQLVCPQPVSHTFVCGGDRREAQGVSRAGFIETAAGSGSSRRQDLCRGHPGHCAGGHDGRQVPLDFVQTGTENARVLTPFLRDLVDRGLDISQGLLVVIDGSKGLRSAVRQAFGKYAVVQRCQWHKRENVVAYLSKAQQPIWRRRLQQAYERPTYQEAKGQLMQLHQELSVLNQSAAASLHEGLEETLSLHELGVFPLLGQSFKTTNCLESLNALIEERCGHVDHWKNSNQKHRWLAASLMDIEPRLRRIQGYRHLPKLRMALMKALRIELTIRKEAA